MATASHTTNTAAGRARARIRRRGWRHTRAPSTSSRGSVTSTQIPISARYWNRSMAPDGRPSSGPGPGSEDPAMRGDDWPQASDAALVVAIARWRQEALAEGYRRHAGAVLALAQRVLRDRSLAEEVVQ